MGGSISAAGSKLNTATDTPIVSSSPVVAEIDPFFLLRHLRFHILLHHSDQIYFARICEVIKQVLNGGLVIVADYDAFVLQILVSHLDRCS